MAVRAGTMAAGIPGGSDRRFDLACEVAEKPPESGGFSGICRLPVEGRENSAGLLDIAGIALLNDALLRRLFPAGSGRIAQLVEQMTLNHRVPGSSPGAPTKPFKHLAKFPYLTDPH